MTRTRIVLIGLGIGVGAILLAAGIAFFVISRDEAPPDDSDLIVHRLDIPDDQNGFTYFQKASEVLYWPETEVWVKAARHPELEDMHADPEDPKTKAAYEIPDRLQRMVDGNDWDEALAAEVLDANKETFALIEKGLACREWQAPVPKGFGVGDPYLNVFMQLARLMRLSSFDLARRGQDQAALAQACSLVQVGHAIAGCRGPVVYHLVGLNSKNLGLSLMARLLPGTHAGPDQLGALSKSLAGMADTREQLAETLRLEYHMTWGVAEYLRSGRVQAREFGMGFLPDSWNCALFFKPNETQRLFVEHFRALIVNSRRPASERVLPEPHWMHDKDTVRMLFSGNLVGRRLYALIMPAIRGLLAFESRSMTETGAVETLLALKQFKMKTGRLPKALDELVPEYLAAVPLDDFDGKPLRYSPEKKILYSVGKDLKDVGGSTKEEIQKWCEKEYPGQPPEDTYSVPVWNLPNPSWPIEF